MLARAKARVFDRAVDVQVSRLRKLVEPDAGKPRYIQTVWGAAMFLCRIDPLR